MSIRWSTQTKASSPIFRAFLASISKSSQQPLKSNLPHSAKQFNNNTRSFQSTPNLTPFASLASISKSIAVAGTGTFLSTLFALYLATCVENLAHETLYEYSPSKYYEIAEEELPVVIRDREMQRRHTGEVKSERVKGRVWEESYLSSEWVISGEEAKELMEEEEELEVEYDRLVARNGEALWQRRFTEKRQLIIEQEEKDFTRAENVNFSWPLWGEISSNKVSSSSVAVNNQLTEKKKLQEEMVRKFQESLMSTAMTA